MEGKRWKAEGKIWDVQPCMHAFANENYMIFQHPSDALPRSHAQLHPGSQALPGNLLYRGFAS